MLSGEPGRLKVVVMKKGEILSLGEIGKLAYTL